MLNMVNFINFERIHIILLCGEAECNVIFTRGLWIRRYANRRVPDTRTIISMRSDRVFKAAQSESAARVHTVDSPEECLRGGSRREWPPVFAGRT